MDAFHFHFFLIYIVRLQKLQRQQLWFLKNNYENLTKQLMTFKMHKSRGRSLASNRVCHRKRNTSLNLPKTGKKSIL